MSHFYRLVANPFSDEILTGAESAYKKLKKKTLSLKKEGQLNKAIYNEYIDKFKNTLEDNLNTSMSITLLYDLLKDKNINDFTKRELVKKFDEVLSLDLLKNNKKTVDKDTLQYINREISKRNIYKKNKEYDKADAIRKELEEKGIIIKDTREGTTFEIID